MIKNDKFDWAMGELMAYATLLEEGHPVRLSGQDVERGTFSHRHSVIKKEDSEEEYIYLNKLSKEQAKFQVYNSILSEYGVLGFENGYAMDEWGTTEANIRALEFLGQAYFRGGLDGATKASVLGLIAEVARRVAEWAEEPSPAVQDS